MARLLVVEDDRNLRDALAETLEDEGHDVRRAATLAEARAALKDASPDVLVLDLMLPDETARPCAPRSSAPERPPASSCSPRAPSKTTW
jgi:DNA-binding response OmpR family regulator